MPVVLEAVTLGTPWRKRQNRVQTIQGLNGGLLIDAENGGMLRRAQIEADDVSRLGFKLGIVAGHVALQAVRPQASLPPDAMHGVFTDAQRRGQLLRQLQCVEPSLGFLRVAPRIRARRTGVSTQAVWPG